MRVALFLLGGTALVLVLAQVLLPGLAGSRISSRVSRYGKVEHVSVSAWPAVKLLWGDADSVTVRAGRLRLSPAQAVKLLGEARGVSTMELTSAAVQVGPLRMEQARLRKHGSSLAAEAELTRAAVKAALPPGFDVELVKSEAGEVQVRASGGLFGVGPSVEAVAGASEGKLVAHPLGLLAGLHLTLFSDPRVFVTGVGASPGAGQTPGYRVSMTARLR